jgi:hypothetical protein
MRPRTWGLFRFPRSQIFGCRKFRAFPLFQAESEHLYSISQTPRSESSIEFSYYMTVPIRELTLLREPASPPRLSVWCVRTLDGLSRESYLEATCAENSILGIRNLRKPRELS